MLAYIVIRSKVIGKGDNSGSNSIENKEIYFGLRVKS